MRSARRSFGLLAPAGGKGATSDAAGEETRTCPACGGPGSAAAGTCPTCETTRSIRSAADARPLATPHEVAGFEIVREIGAGGMGTVYEAIDRKMHRRVALKLLSRRLSASGHASARFAREAWIGGRLSHPNLVKVFDRGEWLDTSFYTMEMVDGGSLHDVIVAMREHGRAAAWGLEFGTREHIAWSIAQVAAAARALDYAHHHGVVHRDIKPMNLLLARDPCAVKIADFGVAKDEEATRMTMTGSMIGTLAYMAPEQIRGDAHRIDGRCDIYALGVTLFELLTLELPFAGATQELYMNAVLTGHARRPSRLNERVGHDLEIVLGKALEKDPQDRYATAAEFALDLANVLAFRPIRARPPSRLARLAKWIHRKPIHALLIAALLVGAPTIAALALRGAQQHRALAHVESENLWTSFVRLYQGARYRESLEALTRLLAQDPDHVKALRARAIVQARLAGAAMPAAQRAALEDRALADASRLVALLPRTSWPYRLRAFLLTRAGRAAEARRDVDRAAALRPAAPDRTEIEFDALLALDSANYESAADLFSRAIALDPAAVDDRINRATALQFLGRNDESRVDYEVASALAPNDPIPRYNLGRILTYGGRLEEGAAHYERALAIDAGDPNVHSGMADNLIRQGQAKAAAGGREAALADFQRAERAARRAIEIDPDHPWAHLNLGMSLREQAALLGSPDRALLDRAMAEYERVQAIWRTEGSDPKEEYYAKALMNQCDASILGGSLERALAVCRDAAEARPGEAPNHYNLAGAYARLGRRAEALDALRRDVDLGDRDAAYLAADPWFEGLRGDPRFSALLRRMRAAAPSGPAR